MTINKHIKKSAQFAIDAFACLFSNPILFIYPFIFLSIPAIIIASRYFDIPKTQSPEYAYHLITTFNTDSLIHILFIMIFYSLLTFVAASISIHTFAILKRKSMSVAKTLEILSHHVGHLVLWGCITMFLVYTGLALLYLVEDTFSGYSWAYRTFQTVHLAIDAFWLFCTFFMLQIHALEKCSLIEALQRSFHLSSRLIPQIIAVRLGYHLGLYLILHIGLLHFMIFIEERYAFQEHTPMLIEGSIESIILIFFFTIYIVLTTTLYELHVKEIGK